MTQQKPQTLDELLKEVRKNKYYKKAYRKLGEPNCYEFGLFMEAFIKKVYEAGSEAKRNIIVNNLEKKLTDATQKLCEEFPRWKAYGVSPVGRKISQREQYLFCQQTAINELLQLTKSK